MGRGLERPTFLAFVELWRARVVDALFVWVGEGLATALVDTFLGHGGWGQVDEIKMVGVKTGRTSWSWEVALTCAARGGYEAELPESSRYLVIQVAYAQG